MKCADEAVCDNFRCKDNKYTVQPGLLIPKNTTVTMIQYTRSQRSENPKVYKKTMN